jgi:hypothetical protein
MSYVSTDSGRWQVDTSKPFIQKTDANAYAIGAALFQGEEKTVENAEHKYSTTE